MKKNILALLQKRIFRVGILLVFFFCVFFITTTPTESMRPTISTSDFAIGANLPLILMRGEIVRFHATHDGNKNELKRIIAVPGDSISISNMAVYVNEKKLDEPYITENPNYEVKKIKLQPGQYFVLGDNRNNSFDSSYYGPIKRNDINGVVLFVLKPFWEK